MTDDDLFGRPAPNIPATTSGPALLPTETDAELLARAAVAEGDRDNPESWQNVASVAVNRAAATGRPISEILSEPGQFEAYGNGSMQKVDPKSPQFQAALRAIQPVLTGQIRTDYDSFLAPDVLAGRGQKTPAWATGTDGKKIGSQLFFSGKYRPQIMTPADQSAWDNLYGGAPAAYKGSGYGGAGQPSTQAPQAQQQAFQFLKLHGFRDDASPLGSSSNPYGLTPQAAEAGVPSGAWYVDLDGKVKIKDDPTKTADYMPDLQIAAAKQREVAAQPLMQRAAGDVGQGFSDIGGSLNKMTGGAFAAGDPAAVALGQTMGGPSSQEIARASLVGVDQERNQFDVAHAMDPLATPGRTIGQLATAAPIMAFGGEGLAAAGRGVTAAIPEAAPVVDFALGRGGGNAFLNAGSNAVANAVQGAGYGALTSETSDRPISQQIGTGALFGGAVGAAAPMVRGTVRTLTGGIADRAVGPEVAALADKATNQYGIPLRASQILGAEDRAMAVKDSNMLSSSSKFAANNAEQGAAFTRAVSNQFGADSSSMTPDVMAAARRALGAKFDQFAQGHNITDPDGLQTRLGGIIHDAQQSMPDSEVTPLLRQVQNIGSLVENGQITGKAYQALVRTGSPLDRLMQSGDSNVRYYAARMKDALDDGIAADATPEENADFQNTRLQYKNLMTIKGLAAKAGVTGAISPAQLAGVVNKSFDDRAFSGAGPLGELAQIGQTFMREPPQSGTVPRLKDMIGPFATFAGAGGLAGGEGLAAYLHDPVLGTKFAVGAGGLAAARLAFRAAQERNLGSGSTQRLIGRSLPSRGGVPQNRFLLPLAPAAAVLGNQFVNAPAAQ